MAEADVFLAKAVESLAGAGLEFNAGYYHNCANRCYYACFQAAIFALLQAGITPRSSQNRWEHSFVRAQFSGQLINRRKLYPPDLRDIMERNYALRRIADYEDRFVTDTQASRALQRSRLFVGAIELRQEGQQ